MWQTILNGSQPFLQPAPAIRCTGAVVSPLNRPNFDSDSADAQEAWLGVSLRQGVSQGMSVMGNAYPASNRRPGSGSSSVHDDEDGGVGSDLVSLLEENARLR